MYITFSSLSSSHIYTPSRTIVLIACLLVSSLSYTALASLFCFHPYTSISYLAVMSLMYFFDTTEYVLYAPMTIQYTCSHTMYRALAHATFVLTLRKANVTSLG